MMMDIGPEFYSAVPPSMTMAERSRSQTNFHLSFMLKLFKKLKFQNHTMDLVHVQFHDRYGSSGSNYDLNVPFLPR